MRAPQLGGRSPAAKLYVFDNPGFIGNGMSRIVVMASNIREARDKATANLPVSRQLKEQGVGDPVAVADNIFLFHCEF